MAQTLILRHERVDDMPLIIGLASRRHLAEVLNRPLGTHGLQQGLHNGQLAVGWPTFCRRPLTATRPRGNGPTTGTTPWNSCQFFAHITHQYTPAKQGGKAFLERGCERMQGTAADTDRPAEPPPKDARHRPDVPEQPYPPIAP
jgi:hypothetical protein